MKKILSFFLLALFIFPHNSFAAGVIQARKNAARQQAIQQQRVAQQVTQQQRLQQQVRQTQRVQQVQYAQAQQQMQYAQAQQIRSAQTQMQYAQAQQQVQYAQAQQKAFNDINFYTKNDSFASEPPPLNYNIQEERTQERANQVVDMKQIWEELTISTEIWPLIMDDGPKRMIVEKYIQWYGEQGIRIKKSSDHYINLIDSMSQNDRNLLMSPFQDVVKFIAIMEYDFDNGEDRDALALKVLGERVYKNNRKRLGID